ncbi:DP-EP family protein [Marinimicrobium locisalis]|uniref:DP-EP family protein n=1 Tax=Marinimicrobium locisalis TaxID=546022 RepID=UPI003221FA75
MHDLCNPLRIDVPRGGSKIASVDLYPSLPEDGEAAAWPMADVTDHQFCPFSGLVVGFDVESTADERHYEQAVLVIHIAQKVQTDVGRWSFFMSGIQYEPGRGDTQHDIDTQVSADGQTLTMTLRNVGVDNEAVDFSYLALYRDRQSGECQIYTSKDPSIRIGRPPAP